MSTALTEAQSRALAGINPGLVAGLRKTVESTTVRGEGAYFSFGKDGLWSFGKENEEITEDDRFLIDVETLATGYVCWTDYSKEELLKKKKNEKLGAKMLLISQGEVDYDTLPDHGWPWKKQVGFRGRFINDPLAGKAAVFESSSGGGEDAYAAVAAAVMQKLQADLAAGKTELAIYPVVKLTNTHYTHKTYGKTYKPVFDIVGWANKDGRMEGLAIEAAAEQQVTKEEVGAAASEQVAVGGPSPVTRRRRG